MNVNVKRLLSILLAVFLVIGLPVSAMAATDAGDVDDTSATEPAEEAAITLQPAYVGIEDPGDAGISLMADIYATLGTCAALDLVPKNTITLRYTDAQGGSHYTEISRISWHYVDSEENIIICLEPDKSSSNGSGHSGDNNIGLEGSGGTIGKDVWYSLTANQRRAIGLVLLYGCPNDYWDSSAGVTTSGVNPNKGYRAATQAIVWEIVAGMRSAVAPYGYTSVSNAKDFWNQCSGVVVGSDGTDYFQKCYNHIVSSLAVHGTVPSFTSKASASAPTITLTGTTTTVTDTNGVLSRFDFTNTSNLVFNKSGNDLTIKTNGTVPTTTFSAYAKTPNPETSVYQLWYNGNTSEYQTLIKLYQPQSDPVPAYFKLKAATGGMKLIKTTEDSKNLSGWQFGIYSDAACTTLISGPHTTDANGEISVDGLSEGTVYVKELGHKDASVDALYECTSTNPQKITITSGQTTTVRFNNDLRTGDAKFVKQTNTGKNLSGWKIGLYYDAACTNAVSGSPFTTGTDGTITVSDLKPGTLYAREIPTDDPYWEYDTSVKEVKIVANQTATVTFTNTHYGRIQFQKTTNTGNHLGGWTFRVIDVNGNHVGNYTTDEMGIACTENLPLGRYTVQELPVDDDYWQVDLTFHDVTVKAGETVVDTWYNVEQGLGWFCKSTNTGENLAGWEITVYSDKACTKEVCTVITEKNGKIGYYLDPGIYYAKETGDTLSRFSNEYWAIDKTVYRFEIKPHKETAVTFSNIHYGMTKIIKKMPDGGSTAGWEFEMYRVSDDAFISSFISGEDGTILVDQLQPGDYRIVENIPENSIYYCETTNPQTVTVVAGQTAVVTFTNRLKPAEIAIQKVDTAGNPLAGAVFLLEWSVDGTNWLPVSSTDSPYVTEGTCTTEGLLDGCITSPETGLVRFTGLHPKRHYRLTEISAPDGYQLLARAVFEGTIPTDEDLTITLTVVDAPIYELPMTGSKSYATMAVSLCICVAGYVGALVYLRRKDP